MTAHHCHAAGCDRPCAPRLFACPGHWRELPEPYKAAIRREYRRGQERTKTPTVRYLAVQRAAVAALAFRPNDEAAARRAAPPMLEAEIWRDDAIAGGHGDPLEGLPAVRPHQPIDHARAWEVVWKLRREVREQDRVLDLAAALIERETAKLARYSPDGARRLAELLRLALDHEGLGRWRVELEADDAARTYRPRASLA